MKLKHKSSSRIRSKRKQLYFFMVRHLLIPTKKTKKVVQYANQKFFQICHWPTQQPSFLTWSPKLFGTITQLWIYRWPIQPLRLQIWSLECCLQSWLCQLPSLLCKGHHVLQWAHEWKWFCLSFCTFPQFCNQNSQEHCFPFTRSSPNSIAVEILQRNQRYNCSLYPVRQRRKRSRSSKKANLFFFGIHLQNSSQLSGDITCSFRNVHFFSLILQEKKKNKILHAEAIKQFKHQINIAKCHSVYGQKFLSQLFIWKSMPGWLKPAAWPNKVKTRAFWGPLQWYFGKRRIVSQGGH